MNDSLFLSYGLSSGDSIHLQVIKREDKIVVAEWGTTSYPVMAVDYFPDRTVVYRYYDEENLHGIVFPKGEARWENAHMVTGSDGAYTDIAHAKNIGRAKIWRNALIFDVYISSDTIEPEDKLEIDVMQDSRGDIRFLLIARTTGDTVINQILKSTYTHFIVEPRQKGNCEYTAILKRSWKPDDPNFVEYHFEDPISFVVYYRE